MGNIKGNVAASYSGDDAAPALSSISCLQCSSLYELDCANPVASQRFLYPCLDSWASTSCLIVEDRGILVRNCSKQVHYEDGCRYRGDEKICSCSQSHCNGAPEQRKLSLSLFFIFTSMLLFA